MASRPHRRTDGGRGPRQPVAPTFPAALQPAGIPDDDLTDSGVYLSLVFADLDLSSRDAVSAEFDQCRFSNVNLSQTKLHRALIRDVAFDRCDLANLRARDSSLSRAAVCASRMTGLSWIDGSFRDVTFDNCRIDLASFRSSGFKDVVFTGCRLEQADFGDADLRGARFDSCDLTGAQFHGGQLSGARFADCCLASIGGVTSLRGAIIKSADALALTFMLADALGIKIEDSPQ
jgi:uncharacterized protein YjbI with pentapeptide repeats